jgi:hypothetical protein
VRLLDRTVRIIAAVAFRHPIEDGALMSLLLAVRAAVILLPLTLIGMRQHAAAAVSKRSSSQFRPHLSRPESLQSQTLRSYRATPRAQQLL